MDVSESDLHVFVPRKVDPCDTCHTNLLFSSRLSLSLLMPGVRTDHPDDTFPFHDLALITNPLYGSFYFHGFILLPRNFSRLTFHGLYFAR
jgi:hypothetical protein